MLKERLTPKEYIKLDCCRCPVCGAQDTIRSKPANSEFNEDVIATVTNESTILIEINCNSCPASWDEVFKISSYQSLEDNIPQEAE